MHCGNDFCFSENVYEVAYCLFYFQFYHQIVANAFCNIYDAWDQILHFSFPPLKLLSKLPVLQNKSVYPSFQCLCDEISKLG